MEMRVQPFLASVGRHFYAFFCLAFVVFAAALAPHIPSDSAPENARLKSKRKLASL
ncbi:hypothetical protein AMTR_s00063p00183700 [Amborella trichopoda]|uniref:Uncharacterized protein n=1 Tax=Amborella trichopoda TaxID=13333 RepID=U5D214_AMBTC|nr:hypothetical protein AMTR_s00063p00183700 [Amborella trichopoda]